MGSNLEVGFELLELGGLLQGLDQLDGGPGGWWERRKRGEEERRRGGEKRRIGEGARRGG